MKIFIFLLLCHISSSVKHSMRFYLTSSSGVPELPDFVAIAMVNEAEVAYYDSNISQTQPKQQWVRKVIGDDSQRWERNRKECKGYHQIFKAETDTFRQRFNQTAAVHVAQQMAGCEWDEETGEVTGHQHYSYNGEDFISLDLNTMTWVAPKPQAVVTKHDWDRDKPRIEFWRTFLLQRCPEQLKRYLPHWKSSHQRTALPSVSLLQKTPSSPVSCHATGFYPDRARMFWRKDGEEIHEGVEHGEILPNHDGSFQMNVDLDISSVSRENWRRYDCVFHLSGEKSITRLDEAVIRTNRVNPANVTTPVTAAVVVLAVVIAACGFTCYRRKKSSDKVSEERLSQEKLNPDKDETVESESNSECSDTNSLKQNMNQFI
ncbi:major histocompatibility complex class I-related gene protein-like [Mugil cephalus]|uniref:major histocompatibility complex class I-related gene protein-like n=1 Tax=Mugil cephalus TaxID=48193 RepID=UPI001FB678C3|nr:major histocompatibility complex class I-related gene protein-like [Mugil cephalus]